MAIYQKKPETVFARLFIPEAVKDGVFEMEIGWGGIRQFLVFRDDDGASRLKITEGNVEKWATVGQYIVVDPFGKTRVMNPEEFHGLFEKVGK